MIVFSIYPEDSRIIVYLHSDVPLQLEEQYIWRSVQHNKHVIKPENARTLHNKLTCISSLPTPQVLLSTISLTDNAYILVYLWKAGYGVLLAYLSYINMQLVCRPQCCRLAVMQSCVASIVCKHRAAWYAREQLYTFGECVTRLQLIYWLQCHHSAL